MKNKKLRNNWTPRNVEPLPKIDWRIPITCLIIVLCLIGLFLMSRDLLKGLEEGRLPEFEDRQISGRLLKAMGLLETYDPINKLECALVQEENNCYNLKDGKGGYIEEFDSWQDSIDYTVQLIKYDPRYKEFQDSGYQDIDALGKVWATDPEWANKIRNILGRLNK